MLHPPPPPALSGDLVTRVRAAPQADCLTWPRHRGRTPVPKRAPSRTVPTTRAVPSGCRSVRGRRGRAQPRRGARTGWRAVGARPALPGAVAAPPPPPQTAAAPALPRARHSLHRKRGGERGVWKHQGEPGNPPKPLRTTPGPAGWAAAPAPSSVHHAESPARLLTLSPRRQTQWALGSHTPSGGWQRPGALGGAGRGREAGVLWLSPQARSCPGSPCPPPAGPVSNRTDCDAASHAAPRGVAPSSQETPGAQADSSPTSWQGPDPHRRGDPRARPALPRWLLDLQVTVTPREEVRPVAPWPSPQRAPHGAQATQPPRHCPLAASPSWPYRCPRLPAHFSPQQPSCGG